MQSGYCLEFLTADTIKLLEGTKNKATKDKNADDVPHVDINEVLLVHCNIVNNDYQHYSRVLNTLVPNKSVLRYFTKIFLIFKYI